MEYTVFGEGFIKRENYEHEWGPCGAEDVPPEEIERMKAVAERKRSFSKPGPASATGGVSSQPQ